jgi:hypothetical protein
MLTVMRRFAGASTAITLRIHVARGKFRMLLDIVVQVALGIDREFPDQSRDVHALVRVANQVIVTDQNQDRPIILQDRGPHWVGPHQVEVGTGRPQPGQAPAQQKRRAEGHRSHDGVAP